MVNSVHELQPTIASKIHEELKPIIFIDLIPPGIFPYLRQQAKTFVMLRNFRR